MSKNIYQFNEKTVNELSTIEIAYEVLKQSKKTFYFKELANIIAEVKDLNEEKLFDHLPQLYTEINIDGRFIHLGQNEWGLKSWYPLEKAEALSIAKDIEEDDEYDLEFSDEDDLLEEEKIFDEEDEEDDVIDDEDNLEYEVNDDSIDEEDLDEDLDDTEDEVIIGIDDVIDEEEEDVDEDEEIEYYTDELEEDYYDEDESEDNL